MRTSSAGDLLQFGESESARPQRSVAKASSVEAAQEGGRLASPALWLSSAPRPDPVRPASQQSLIQQQGLVSPYSLFSHPCQRMLVFSIALHPAARRTAAAQQPEVVDP
jgi:hypothetical protein